MVPDETLIMETAKGLERAYHKNGWDQECLLGLVYDMADDMKGHLPSDTGRLGAVMPFPIQPQELHPHPPTGIRMLVHQTIAKGADSPPPANLYKGLLGVCFVGEGYSGETSPEERDGRDLADVPGSLEVRFVDVLDCSGRYYKVMRVRGEEPSARVFAPHDKEFAVTGNLPEALWMLLIALGNWAPDGFLDLKAMDALGEMHMREHEEYERLN